MTQSRKRNTLYQWWHNVFLQSEKRVLKHDFNEMPAHARRNKMVMNPTVSFRKHFSMSTPDSLVQLVWIHSKTSLNQEVSIKIKVDVAWKRKSCLLAEFFFTIFQRAANFSLLRLVYEIQCLIVLEFTNFQIYVELRVKVFQERICQIWFLILMFNCAE